MPRTITAVSVTALLLAAPALQASAQTDDTSPEQETGEAAVPPGNPVRNAYFGDLHLHTGMSFDAAVASGIQAMPDTAYRFAKGYEVTYLDKTVKRDVPLDFLAVTDHSEYLGMVRMAQDPDGPLADTKWFDRLTSSNEKEAAKAGGQILGSGFYGKPGPIEDLVKPEYKMDNWQIIIDAAERHYEPGEFTTFAAYEWSNTPDNGHFHRNVIFRGPDYPEMPFSALDSRDPEDLWAYADSHREQGIDSVLIPHNSNLSDGLMFAFRDMDGDLMDRAYAETRARNEPLVEVTQVKGTSETHPVLSPTDEFAGFEILDHFFVNEEDFTKENLRGSYVRHGYRRGLQIEARTGVNPYKLGMVGASDYHTAVSGTEEYNYTGALGPDNLDEPETLLKADVAELSASGITGVWAERNTRESIFNALKRREVFATSGPRMRVRMFAGWDYAQGLVHRNDWLQQAYAQGVPMGADMPAPPSDREREGMRFLLEALKDPNSGNLDRIQIVKVWFEGGESHEKVYDAVWAGERKRDPETGKVPPVGNTVDVEAATYTNDIGAVQLSGEWTDPDFDPDVPAIYYARVIEIPTPRWTTYLAAENNLPLTEKAEATIQERAWTSPIFYTPENFGGSNAE